MAASTEERRKKHREYMRKWNKSAKAIACKKRWQGKNPGRNNEWRRKNPELARAYSRGYFKKWRKNNAKRCSWVKGWLKKQLSTKTNYHVSQRLRTRVYQALKEQCKIGRFSELLGCSIPELRLHLESQFKSGMSWDNYGTWHIDHIRPCASFDLLKPEEQRSCFHFTNLQPLWARDNLKKGRR